MRPVDKSLPRFAAPPVVEVAISAQFQPLPKLTVPVASNFWRNVQERFPKAELHPPLDRAIERTGVRNMRPAPQISVISAGEVPQRFWMLNADGTQLLQVQQDRFVRNWRRYHSEDLPYPHFEENLLPEFLQDFDRFSSFAVAEGLGEIRIDQCELTYTNHIQPSGVWQHHGELHRVFRGWSADYGLVTAMDGSGIGIRVNHPIEDAEGAFVGRLYLEINSGFVNDESGSPRQDKPVFVLKLTARGRPPSEGKDGMVSFLDLGHRLIVTTFANVTTPEMHDAWRRTQ